MVVFTALKLIGIGEEMFLEALWGSEILLRGNGCLAGPAMGEMFEDNVSDC